MCEWLSGESSLNMMIGSREKFWNPMPAKQVRLCFFVCYALVRVRVLARAGVCLARVQSPSNIATVSAHHVP